MKQIAYIIAILTILANAVSAKEIKYPVSEIAPALKENAHTVVRLYQQELEIISEKSAFVKVTEVRTILNKNGQDNALFIEYYDPMRKISNIKGRVYNEAGEVIKKISADDILDRSYITGYTVFNDHRVKYIDPKVGNYPYTVEYSYELDFKQTLFLPNWNHNTENTSYENSIFKLTAPNGFPLKYKEYNLTGGVEKSAVNDKDCYKWSLVNLKATVDEPYSSFKTDPNPQVDVVLQNFYVDGTAGSTNTWKDLGIWASTLNLGKDIVPEETKTKIREITQNCKSDFDKVQKVYEFMQKKSRYVSIQVGIGGWQPFDAETVDRLSYGDCKALSNYTKALLSVAGVKSYYTLVRAGGNSPFIDTEFPSSQFNHAIVCVPTDKDTIWLECTNQRLPCGFNSDFTDDRDVLIVDGENSHLAHTRVYSAKENWISRSASVTFDEEEIGKADIKTKYIGISSEDASDIYYSDAADQLKTVTENISLPSFSLIDFNYQEHKSRTPYYDENINLTFTNYIRKMGDNMLLPVNLMNKLTSIPDKVRNRKTEMAIRRDELETDTIVYHLPKNVEITGLPESSKIENKFGKYSSSTTLKGNTLTYVRRFELNKGIFPPEAYAEFREFLEEVSTQDCAIVSLKKVNNSGTK